MNKDICREEIFSILPQEMVEELSDNKYDWEKINEIRIRVNYPMKIHMGTEMVDCNGIVTIRQIQNILEKCCCYSMYAYENELRQGFITIRGGHRIGIGGEVVYEGGMIKNFRYITFMCIRVAHEIDNCSEKIMPFIYKDNCLKHTLIVSAPGCGKTTLLRDIIKKISHEYKNISNISVIDERSEIASCYNGVPQIEIGDNVDVIDGCPKALGMMMSIRSMAPDIVAVDEIGGIEECRAIEYCINCGCTVIGTVHGNSYSDLINKPELNRLIKSDLFSRFIFLDGDWKRKKVAVCYELLGESLSLWEG
ncbi:MAG: stage III sporulation protein AA [Lachnospira sp.]